MGALSRAPPRAEDCCNTAGYADVSTDVLRQQVQESSQSTAASRPSSRINPYRPCVGSYWPGEGDGKPLRVVCRMGGRTPVLKRGPRDPVFAV